MQFTEASAEGQEVAVEVSLRTIDSSTHKLVDGTLVRKETKDSPLRKGQQKGKLGPGSHLNILQKKRKQKARMTFDLPKTSG